MEIMNKIFYILFCIFITSCSTKHYINLSDEEVKNISIPKNYKVIYCICNNNPLQLTIIDKLKKIGIKIIKINDYSRIDEIDSKKSIVIYGYSKKINGSPKKYTITNLVSRSTSTKCGKGCTVSKSWNELIRKNVTTSGNSRHNNVLIYKIDENTELLMALNSGDRYSLKLETKQETGSKQNIISETNAYQFN
jgi:hypothetical protein